MNSEPPHVGRYWSPLADGRILCELCPRACKLGDGQRAFCFVRQNQGGQMVLTTYGRSSGFCIDPIEKKPLNHFHPGSSVLSFGTAGCNLGCKFCQNWSISKAREWDTLADVAGPDDIADAAVRAGAASVAFTYNDPVIFAEYAIDVAKACRARGIKTVAVTAGYVTDAARPELFSVMDAANVDLKAFTEEFYWAVTNSHLQPVLDTLRYLRHETEVWFEITTLLIPGKNDSPDEIDRQCAWIAEHLGCDVPLHFTAFHPDHRMRDVAATPPETLTRARAQALAHGLRHVYTGNVHDSAGQSTYCGSCGELLIERDWYRLGIYRVTGAGTCTGCGAAVPGRFGAGKGAWGPKRLPVTIG
ncbi:MAG TPA: AmmeMemoRadiSam system radical SAM enzyme [Kofleriaceae bacterium]|nr:AmmeMemoRadiSam system radical SAM enzyme [Kofleriaceae bacterium]